MLDVEDIVALLEDAGLTSAHDYGFISGVGTKEQWIEFFRKFSPRVTEKIGEVFFVTTGPSWDFVGVNKNTQHLAKSLGISADVHFVGYEVKRPVWQITLKGSEEGITLFKKNMWPLDFRLYEEPKEPKEPKRKRRVPEQEPY